MNIRLPKKFIYTDGTMKNYAYVNRGRLYIKGYVNFEDLMYNLAYNLDGYERCGYCNCYLTANKRTIDHMYPRIWGGISIPNNLIPSCKSCNQEKKDMTKKQFIQYRKLTNRNEKDIFYQECVKENTQIIKNGEYVLPKNWISEYDITIIAKYISFKHLERQKSQKLEEYYEQYKQYPHPIVVSANEWLIKGKHILFHAKRHGIIKVPAIILDNVIVIKYSP